MHACFNLFWVKVLSFKDFKELASSSLDFYHVTSNLAITSLIHSSMNKVKVPKPMLIDNAIELLPEEDSQSKKNAKSITKYICSSYPNFLSDYLSHIFVNWKTIIYNKLIFQKHPTFPYLFIESRFFLFRPLLISSL